MKFLKELLISLLILLIGGFALEQMAEYYYDYTYPPVGRLIEVNGHNIHIVAEGSGNKTIIFVADWRTPNAYVDFYPLHKDLINHAKIVTYDRPGYGWSDSTDKARDVDTLAQELHQLLTSAEVKPPYIFVAHSLGSLETLRFAQLYKDEVAAIVFLDGLEPEGYQSPSLYDSTYNYIEDNVIYLANKLFITRLLFSTVYDYSATPLSTKRPNFNLIPADLQKIDEISFLKNYNNKNQAYEGNMHSLNSYKIRENDYLGNIPIVAITTKNQHAFAKWSNNSKQILVEDNKKALHWQKHYLIKHEILTLLKK